MSIPIMRFGGNDDDNNARGVAVNNQGHVKVAAEAANIITSYEVYNASGSLASGTAHDIATITTPTTGTVGKLLELSLMADIVGSTNHQQFRIYTSPGSRSPHPFTQILGVRCTAGNILMFSSFGLESSAGHSYTSNDMNGFRSLITSGLYYGNDPDDGIQINYYQDTGVDQTGELWVYYKALIIPGEVL